jgi:3-dehydroquinate synthase
MANTLLKVFDTSAITQRVQVSFEYPVVFTRHAFAPENTALLETICRLEPNRRHRVLVLIDSGVDNAWPDLRADIGRYADRYQDHIELVAEPDVIPGGEEVKGTPVVLSSLQAQFHALHMDRHSIVLIVGGGAVLDAAGFAAATTHRGLRVVRMPTTVLSQNDSGVGVKNGINAFGAKNFLGSFAPPFAVVNDIEFLSTLSPRDRTSGMAEAIKVALIRDRAFFDWMVEHSSALAAYDEEAMATMIRRSAELHLRHIATSGDAFETGNTRPLDFGHWAAHKLETMTSHALRHGEAVAIGMALDARYSVEVGLLGKEAFAAITGLLDALGLPFFSGALLEDGSDGQRLVLDGLREFREHLGGDLTITLLAGIGQGVEVREIHEEAMLRAIRWLKAREAERSSPTTLR